jgi:pyruvate/2-oxoglutarate dehydrogenase complex dihydrolipoamide dehydrogenase (E3) component
VKVRHNTSATAAGIIAEKPDAVILATGARYSAGGHSNHLDRDIPGHDREFVYLPEEILLGKVQPKGNVVLLDGEGMHTGIGLAEKLAAAGCDVECITPHIAPMSPRLFGTQEGPFLMKRLRAAGVKLTTSSYIKSIGDHKVVAYDVYSEQERIIEKVDAVILATGREQVNGLERELDGKVSQLFTVGDALAARMWATASYEGHKFARYIGEPRAPASFMDVYFAPDDPASVPIPADMARPSLAKSP